MTRPEATEFLKTKMGIENPTEEQLHNFLNSIADETSNLKGKADEAKTANKRVKELEEELEQIRDQQLSDVELANKERDKQANKVKELEAQIANMKTKNGLIANGLTDEEAEQFIDSIASGSFDASILGNIITDRTTKAAAAKEQELLDNTPNPNGGAGGGAEKSLGEIYALKYNESNPALD